MVNIMKNPNIDVVTDVQDLSEVGIVSDGQLVPLDTVTSEVTGETKPTLTREQIAAYLELMQKKHNSQCRKPGFKDHFHQPAGSKIERALAKNGSVYGPRSIVTQAFDNIRKQAWDLSGKAQKYVEVGAKISADKAARKAQKVSTVSA